MAELLLGTCSWKYDSWTDLVYSDKKEINFLEEYSRMFNTVEVDQWFWSLFEKGNVVLPNPKVVKDYANSVPENFKFSIKIPNSVTLTHYYQRNKTLPLVENPYFLSTDLFGQFLSTINQLGKKTGPLMFQFEYLNKKKMPSQEEFQIIFSQFINSITSPDKLAVEIRNPNYLNSSYFEFLRENNLAHVFLQGYFMPPIYDIYNKYHDFIRDFCVIRLHGPDRKGIEAKSGGIWNKIIEEKDSEIEKVVSMIHDLLNRDVDIYVNVNNHYEGSAPLTIEKIKKMIYGA